MSDETLIADLVRAGVSDDLVGRVARLILSRDRHVTSRDKIADRRTKDNARQQKRRQKIKETKVLAKANDVAITTAVSRDSHADNRIASCDLKNLSCLSSSVETKKDQQVRTEYVDGKKPKRGARIPADWRPSEAVTEWCRARGVVDSWFAITIEEFIDYWIAVPGQRGTKLDWDATFRNRIRQKGSAGGARAAQPQPSLLHGAKHPTGVYVKSDTPEWDAWCRYLGKTSLPTDKAGGWRFDTLWPPDMAPQGAH